MTSADKELLGDVYEGGSGSTLVLLHGLTGTWHIWKPVLPLLEARHRVVAVTLPGHDGGRPLAPGTEPTVAAMADALIAELQQRGITSAHVAGNSLGGWLALELARRGFAKSVVALSPAGGWTSPKDLRAVALPFRIMYALMPVMIMLTTLFLGAARIRRALARQTMEHGDRVAATDFRVMLRAISRTIVLPGVLRAFKRHGAIEPLDAANTPIRITWGTHDRVIPFERYGHLMLERVATAEHLMLQGVGHVPMYDDPQAVAETILQVTESADSGQVRTFERPVRVHQVQTGSQFGSNRPRKWVAFDVLKTERFQSQLKLLAEKLALPLAQVRAGAEKGLREIVSVKSPLFSFLFDHVLGPMHTRAWTLDVDHHGLERVRTLNQKGTALVFLPTHRSYADPFILTQVLRESGMPRNHILGGDNVGFFPLGTIIRRSGGVLIRRSFKDDEVYKLVVREYLRYLVASGSNLEWYMEGGRSRTGKLRPPKYGLLRYLVDAVESGGATDLLLVPVSTTYDQLHEVGLMASEETGATKSKEGISWLMDYARTQQKWIGKAYVRFGEPLSLREALVHAGSEQSGSRWALDKVAFEVFQRINHITPVTAPALVTLALLGVRDRALTLREVHGLIIPLLDYASQRGLPTAPVSALRDVGGVEEVLDALAGSGVVSRYDRGLDPVFKIEPGKHSVAAFYRNSAIHWFVNRAIIELGVMDAALHTAADSLEHAWGAAYALRDLLKFEFFFSDKQIFREEIKAEALLLDSAFREHIAAPETRGSILKHAPFLIAHRVLPAFLEAYFIVADRLAAQPAESAIDEKSFLSECVAVGQQYVLQKRLKNPECVSRELFTNALSLAANRGLLQPGAADLAQRRRRFADEMTTTVASVAAIDEYDQHMRTGAMETT